MCLRSWVTKLGEKSFQISVYLWKTVMGLLKNIKVTIQTYYKKCIYDSKVTMRITYIM